LREFCDRDRRYNIVDKMLQECHITPIYSSKPGAKLIYFVTRYWFVPFLVLQRWIAHVDRKGSIKNVKDQHA
jgi:hypothetical protein